VRNVEEPRGGDLPPNSKVESGFTSRPSKESWSYLAGFFLAILLASGFMAFHIHSSYRQELAFWQARQSSLADNKTQIVQTWLKERHGDAELQSTRPSIRTLLADPRPARSSHPGVLQRDDEATRLLDEVVRVYGYVALYVLDARGQVIGHSSGAGGISDKGAEAARAVVRTAEYRVDLLAEESGKCLLSFSTPIYPVTRFEERSGGKRPEVAGVIMLVMDASQTLFPLLKEGVKTRTGETVLMRREGNGAVFLTPLRHLPTGTPLGRPLSAKAFAARSALEGQETFGEFVDYRGVRILAATRRIPETGWGLVSKIDREEALEDFRGMAWMEGLAAALLLTIIGVLFWGHRRQVLSRILQREGEKFRALLESAPDPMVICDAEGRIALANAQVETEYGHRPDELLGKAIDILIPESRRADHREQFNRALLGGSSPAGPLRFELFGVRKDGTVFPTEVAMGLIAVGQERFVATAKRDITERRRRDAELRRTVRALRTLSECNQVLVRAQSEPELMREVCEILVQTGGYRMAWVGLAEQGEAKAVRPVAHAGFEEGYLDFVAVTWEDTERGRGPTGTAVRTGKPVVARDIASHPAFSPWREEALKREYASSVALPLSIDSEVFGALSIYTSNPEAFDDQEVHLLAELARDLAYGISVLRTRAAHARVEELDRFFTLSHDMLCIAGFDGYFKRLNPAWEKSLGWSEQELLAKPYIEFVHPEDREATLGEARKLAAGGVVISFNNRYLCKDGTYKWLYWSSVSLCERQLIYAAARDISDQKMLDEQIQKVNARLAAANQELEAFCYSVSHDLRAPLRHIDGFSKLLLERYREELPDQGRHYLDQVCASTRHMGALIDDLLNLSRVGRQDVKWQVTGFNSLVAEVLRDLRPHTEGRRIEWKIGDLPFVECDPPLMKIVFTNLLSNAVKYTRPREHAVIEITTATENGHPVVSVRDNGVGFNMKYADKLFGVFQRLHRQEDFEGTGIGLATVQRIIQKHGGRIWAEAELNQGAVFRFTVGSAADHNSHI